MSTVTPRRNPRRAASQTPSVVSTVQTRRTAQTSGRRELATRRSNAYGGRGARMAAPERVVATGADAGLEELDARRQQSVVESESSAAETASPTPARSPSPASVTGSVGVAATTAGDVSLSYGPAHEAGLVASETESEASYDLEQPLTSGWLTRQAMKLGSVLRPVPEFLARLFYAGHQAASLFSAVALGVVAGVAIVWIVSMAWTSAAGFVRPSELAPMDWLQQLPELVVLHENKVTGDLEIPSNLWTAIETVNRASPREESLDLFSRQNEARLSALVDRRVDKFGEDRVNRRLADAMSDEHIMHRMKQAGLVTKAELVGMIKEQFADFKESAEKKLREEFTPHLHHLVSSMQKDLLKQIPKAAFDRFIASRALAAAELSLTKVNFFSAALGARILHQYTSPTVAHHTNRVATYWSRVFGRPETAHKAVKVLSPWSEAAQAWCAAPGKLGRASVGIMPSHEVYPSSFTIEHVPRDATPDITSAPKWVELWAKVPSPAIRSQVEKHAVTDPVRKCTGGSDLPDDFVCLGRRFYDIHGLTHIQTWDLDVDLQAHAHAVGEKQGADELVLKVTNNWGSDRTCLYRTRVHGETVEGFPVPNAPGDL